MAYTFKEFVADSNLSEEDKSMWADLLDNISDEMIALFEEEIGGSDEELVKFTEEIARQKIHIEEGDMEAILEDLDKEEM